MKIVVLDGHTLNPGDLSWDNIAEFGDLEVFERSASDQIFTRAKQADVLLTNKTPINRELIHRLEHLKFVSVLATGHDVVDCRAAREKNIPVSNVPIYGTEAVAQHVMAMLLSFLHRVERHDQAVKNGEWVRSPDFCFSLSPVTEMVGKTFGVIGLGRIGRATAKLADAFGMKLIAFTRSNTDPLDYDEFRFGSIEEVFAQSDVVSLHCPQTDENLGFVNQALLSQMKSSAILINTARGSLINETDLAAALNAGEIAGACLDVVGQEPMRNDNPLLMADNCLITPHMAWTSFEARHRLLETTAGNIAAFIAGSPVNVVN